LSLTLFGSGFGSDTYSTTQAGFQLEQSITHYVAAVGRVTAYQVYQGEGYNSPFVTEAVGALSSASRAESTLPRWRVCRWSF
jgi:hypothetical protein